MTDREVQAITQFLLKFGYLGCHQIIQCRRIVEKMSRGQIAEAVLDIRASWKREGLDSMWSGSTRSLSWPISIAPISTPACQGAVGREARSRR